MNEWMRMRCERSQNGTTLLKFVFYAWISWHFLSISAFIFFHWHKHTHQNNPAIQRQTDVTTTCKSADLLGFGSNDCQLLFFFIFVTLFFYYLYVVTMKFAFGCYVLKHIASFSTQHEIFYTNWNILKFARRWVRSVQQKSNLILFTWNSANPFKANKLNGK